LKIREKLIMERPKITVIIPAYNIENLITRCVESVVKQTYPEELTQILVVDDGSTDDTGRIIDELADKYSNVTALHEPNGGSSRARNYALSKAEGDYIGFVDSDDYIAPNCIERLASVVDEDPSIEMVQGNCIMSCEDKESRLYRLGTSIITSNNDETRKAFYKDRNIYISVWNRLLKKSFIEEYQLYCREGVVFEDFLWVFYLMKHLERAYMCEEVTYFYVIREGSIIKNDKPETVGCYAVIFDEILYHLTAGREQEEIKGFLYYFIKRYVSYVKIAPEFKDTIRLYKRKAQQYHCWYGYVVLSVASGIGYIGNPMKLLGWLNGLRWRMKRKVRRAEG
jgi:glycosyltransferase involved in cell wall biosynthesis